MKIKRDREFAPIIITLESVREARILLSALVLGEDQMRIADFGLTDLNIARDFIEALQSEGIREI